MKWIMVFQDHMDMVTYISDENESRSVMPYKKFIQFISSYLKERIEDFYTTLNRFSTIYIDCQTGVWQEMPLLKEDNSFVDMFEFNKPVIEENKKRIDRDFLKGIKKHILSYKNLK